MDILKFLEAPTSSIYHTLPTITLDFETTNKEYGSTNNPDNHIVLTSYLVGDVMTSVWEDEYHLPKDLLDMIEGDDNPHILVAHNAKFELRWLDKAGVDLTKVLVWDTMLADKVALGNNPARLPLDLGSVAQRRGLEGKEPVVDQMIKMGVCPSTIPKSLLLRRCEYDVQTTYNIFLQQREELEESGKLGVMLTRCLLTPVLADIETNGLYLDKERVMEVWQQAKSDYSDVSLELASIQDINWNSTKQKAVALYDWYKFKELKRWGKPITTPKGARMTNIDTIKLLKATTKIQKRVKRLLIEQSVLNAQLTKALDKFKDCIDNDDLLFAEFNQHITVTHRLSSNGQNYKMQLQNIARVFKRLFLSRHEGWDTVEADGANLEFRIAIELGDDEQGKIDIANPDFDAHQFTADTITAAGQPTERQEGKSHTFKPLFGGSSGTDAERAYYTAFKEKYSGITRIQQVWLDEAMKHKSVTLPWGMQFFFPNTKYTRKGYQVDSTQICNYPIQSFATAEIIPIAIVYTWHLMKAANMRSFLVNTVHDSVIAESPPEEREQLDRIFIESFTTRVYTYLEEVYGYTFKVALGVGIKRGSHWNEGEEANYDVVNNLTNKDRT